MLFKLLYACTAVTDDVTFFFLCQDAVSRTGFYIWFYEINNEEQKELLVQLFSFRASGGSFLSCWTMFDICDYSAREKKTILVLSTNS